MNDSQRDSRRSQTVADFGEQWLAFRDNPGYYGSRNLLADLIHPFFVPEDFAGATVAEIGSGTGRIVLMLAGAGAARIIAVEPSAAMEVLRANTREFADRIRYQQLRGDQFIADEPMDFVLSIGVLHHIPDPAPVVERMRAALRPGGHAIVWLYGREGNRLYLSLVQPMRAITTRLPHAALVLLSRVIDIPTRLYMAACRYLRLPMHTYMRNHLARLTPDVRRLTIYDQLNPKWARYYIREEAVALLEAGGFSDVRCHHRHNYSWLVVGRA